MPSLLGLSNMYLLPSRIRSICINDEITVQGAATHNENVVFAGNTSSDLFVRKTEERLLIITEEQSLSINK